MDWSKAKTLLIVAFIITNIFLGYNIHSEKSRQNEIQIVDSRHLENVEQHLNDNGISLSIGIPNKVVSLPMLTVKYKNFDSDEVAKKILGKGYSKEIFNNDGLKKEIFKGNGGELIIENNKRLAYKNKGNRERVRIPNEEAAAKIANDFLKQHKLMKDDIIPDRIYHETGEYAEDGPAYKLVYNQTYKDKFLGQSYIHVYVNHSGVVAVEAMLLECEKIQQPHKKVIPATEALMGIMNTILQENKQPISINEIEIGYYFSPARYADWKEVDSGTAIPSWKITIQNGKTYYIEAYKN